MPTTAELALPYPALSDAPSGPGAIQALADAVTAKLPRGTLAGGFAQRTTLQTGITAVADLTGLAVTVTSGASRRIRVSAFVPCRQQTAGGVAQVNIQEGATVLTSAFMTAGIAQFLTLIPVVILTPSAGAHTYKLTAQTSAGTFDTAAAAASPAFILVEDIGV